MPRTLLCYISIRDTCMLRGGVSIAPRLSINTCVFVISESGVPERIKVLNLASFLLLAKSLFLYSQELFNADIRQNLTLEEVNLEKQK